MIKSPQELQRYLACGDAHFFKSTPSAPKPVDPYVQAGAQTQLNTDAALTSAALQRINQYTPYGSMTYKVDNTPDQFNQAGYEAALANYKAGTSDHNPTQAEFTTRGVPNVSSNIDFTPQGQQLFDQQNRINTVMGDTAEGLAGRARDSVGQGYDTSGLSKTSFDPAAFAGQRQQVIDSVYKDQTARLDPRFQREQQALETQLANQGIARGTEAWDQAMGLQGTTKNDAYRGALAQALQMGGQEQSRLFSDQMTGNQRNLETQSFLRNAPLNELNAYRSGVQLQGPQFSGPVTPGGVGAANIGGAFNQQYQGQLNEYNSKVAGNNAMTSGLFSLGSTLLGMPKFSGLFGL